MAIEIPDEVAFFLNVIGVPYPDVDEDDVRALAGHVRDFADSIRATHDSATGLLGDLGTAYSGYSYEALLRSWAAAGPEHREQLDTACRVVAAALDGAAEVIAAMKAAVLAELAALAALFGAALCTPAAPALLPSLAGAARYLCAQLRQLLLGYVLAEVIVAAVEPLEEAIPQLVERALFRAASALLDVPDAARPLHIEPDEVRRCAQLLDEHADELLRHASVLAGKVAGLDFRTGSGVEETGPHPLVDLLPPGVRTESGNPVPIFADRWPYADGPVRWDAPAGAAAPPGAGASDAGAPKRSGAVGDRPGSGPGPASRPASGTPGFASPPTAGVPGSGSPSASGVPGLVSAPAAGVPHSVATRTSGVPGTASPAASGVPAGTSRTATGAIGGAAPLLPDRASRPGAETVAPHPSGVRAAAPQPLAGFADARGAAESRNRLDPAADPARPGAVTAPARADAPPAPRNDPARTTAPGAAPRPAGRGGAGNRAGEEPAQARKPATEPARTPWRRPTAKVEAPTATQRPRTPWRTRRSASVTVPTIRPRDDSGTP